MTALLLPWEIATDPWKGVFAEDLATLARDGVLRKTWSVQDAGATDTDSDIWLVVVTGDGTPLGLIGHGVLIGDRSIADDPELPSEVTIAFDLLLEHGEEILLPPSLGFICGSGSTAIHPRTLTSLEAQGLRDLWSRTVPAESGSIDPVPGTLPSSAVRRRIANRFETDPDLRRAVLAHRGSVCHACAVDGEQKYGDAGLELMQVHLITPVRFIDEEFRPDILTDLVPLCPNCHVVAHVGTTGSLSVADLRRLLRSSGFLRGSVLSDDQIEAEGAARKILNAGT